MASDPKWVVSPHDGRTHAFSKAGDDGVSEALCGELAMESRLIDPEEFTGPQACHMCQIKWGTILADRHGDAAWRANA